MRKKRCRTGLLDQLRAYLNEKKSLLEELGMDTTEIDGQILQLNLDRAKEQAAEQQRLHKEKWDKITGVSEKAPPGGRPAHAGAGGQL